MRAIKVLIALPVILLMVGFAKMAQYTAVEAFGDRLGFDVASLTGLIPILILYFWVAAKLPRSFGGQKHG
ncbi:hypothetical protein [Qipengyuania spongiae]|uniref:Uncharacterized protein n=1 Tax=Qipengyuania spongiae TaxID=2909673 RepID=A0ABY5T0U1_9SPHN|nr:hypothetical protein [Qipengyuania spongiae]UVI38958.1 hypothetical protein L1F33_12045 [Qipengyuania spongiae]